VARRHPRELILDIGVGLVAVLALFFLVRERLLPWIADLSVLDPGEAVKDPPALVDARTGDPLRLESGVDHLLLVLRSTCPACARAMPAWRRLAAERNWVTTAVGLEAGETGGSYIGVHLPTARAAVPAEIDEFTRRFRITVVPTTLLIDREGRLVARHAGPLEDSDVVSLRERAGPPPPHSVERRHP
jgi:hypothetical protein